MNGFSTEQARDRHFDDCIRNKSNNISMPTGKNRTVGFYKFQNKIPCPILIYNDFEAVSVEKKRIIEKHEEKTMIGEDGKEEKKIIKTQIKETYHEHHA